MLCISTSFAVSPSQLYTFTASQLPYSDRGWVLNRAQRQRSCNAPLGIRHAMTIQRRLQRCPKLSMFSVVIRLTTETKAAHAPSWKQHWPSRARIVMGRDGSWWIVHVFHSEKFTPTTNAGSLTGSLMSLWSFCFSSSSFFYTITWTSDFISMFAQEQRWRLSRSTTANAAHSQRWPRSTSSKNGNEWQAIANPNSIQNNCSKDTDYMSAHCTNHSSFRKDLERIQKPHLAFESAAASFCAPWFSNRTMDLAKQVTVHHCTGKILAPSRPSCGFWKVTIWRNNRHRK